MTSSSLLSYVFYAYNSLGNGQMQSISGTRTSLYLGVGLSFPSVSISKVIYGGGTIDGNSYEECGCSLLNPMLYYNSLPDITAADDVLFLMLGDISNLFHYFT